MIEVRVVMVEPKYEGNVGAVARGMKNFGVADLRLVRPCAIGEEARRRAMHGAEILESARHFGTLAEAVAGTDLVVATSSVATESEKKFHRIAMTPRELARRLEEVKGSVALVFGREDFGLSNEDLKACDILVSIPSNPEDPALNVAQAAAILLYEIFGAEAGFGKPRTGSALEKRKLYEAFGELLARTNYPAHKRERTKVMFRRLMGRAAPTKWEFHALMGVFQRATKRILRLEGKR